MSKDLAVVVELGWVLHNGDPVARLEPGSRREVLARDNWRVVGLDGKVIGFVKRPGLHIRWTASCSSRRHFNTMERALEYLLVARGVIEKGKSDAG